MKKFVFVTSEELSQVILEIYSNKGENVQAETSYCEDTDRDIVIVTNGDLVTHVPIEELQNDLSVHFGHTITHYDEMEVGDFGVGFLFFF